MFGQTAGISETVLTSKSNYVSTPTENKSVIQKKEINKKIVKVVDFEKENKNKIKIKTF